MAAGGGGGGGAGGKGSKKGKGKKGAGKKKGKKNAKGGKKGAKKGNCKAGKGGGKCTKHDKSGTAGHPVDVATGVMFTEERLDLDLPGPLPFEFGRAYSTGALERDVGFGAGWSHSLGWTVEAHRSYVRVWSNDGTAVDFDMPAPGAPTQGDGEPWVLHRETWGFLLDTDEGIWRIFSAEEPGHPSTFRLTAIEDRCGNRVSITYDDGRLVEVVDSVGRRIRFQSNQGHIVALEVKNAQSQGQWVRFATYSYDAAGNLASVTDAESATTRFEYDEARLMTLEAQPDGLSWHFVYDSQQRCIETWGDYGVHPMVGLAPEAPTVLADGATNAKGVQHVRLTFLDDECVEVADSIRVTRYLVNEHGTVDKGVDGAATTTRTFDDRGFCTSSTDAAGRTEFYEHDSRGRLTKRTDPRGGIHWTTYGPDGNPIEIGDERGGVTRVTYDPRGLIESSTNPVGALFEYRYDQRGNLVEEIQPHGGHVVYEYDAHCNVTRMTMPNGGVFAWAYDEFGNVTSTTDPTGLVTRFAVNTYGAVLATYEANGGVSRETYDAVGNLVELTDADDRTEKYEHGCGGELIAVRQPNGDVTRLEYNREGWLVRVRNPQGETYEFTYDSRHNVIQERSFSGRVMHYRYDIADRLIEIENGLGQKTAYAYDELDQLVETTYADGTTATFGRDVLGQIETVRTDTLELRFERDALGRVVREAQTLGGRSHVVESTYDPMGERARLTTSLGHEVSYVRDALSERVQTTLDGTLSMRHERNVLGHELRRMLPGGGYLENVYDASMLTRRRAVNPARRVELGAQEPEWVGQLRPAGTTIEKAFGYSRAGEMVDRFDTQRNSTKYRYDARGRLLEALSELGAPELFDYDADSNLYERGGNRRYGAGDLLEQAGAARFVWDQQGQLVERHVQTPEGESKWGYAWTGQGLLSSVTRPDGAVVEFDYDPFGRRLAKRLRAAAPPGTEGATVVDTRYVWDDETIIHEIESRQVAGDTVVVERTFAYDDDERTPLAQRESHGGMPGPWLHILNDVIGTPEELVDDHGDVVGSIKRSAFGLTTPSNDNGPTTRLRFQGQIEDPETGLYYNRFRYYDPSIGRYISADPLGLAGGQNLYDYGDNPIMWVDPWGLTHHAKATVPTKGGKSKSDDFDSHFEPGWSEKVKEWKKRKEKGVKNPRGDKVMSPGKARRECHTEFKICKWAEKHGKPLAGKTIKIEGKLPPCNNCAKKMRDWCKENKCKIEYTHKGGTWPNSGKRFRGKTHYFP